MSEFIEKNGIIVNSAFEQMLTSAGFNNYIDFMYLKDCVAVKVKKNRSVFKFTIKDETAENGERVLYLKRHIYSGREKLSFILNLKEREDGYNEWEQTIALNKAGFNVMTPVVFGEKKLGNVPFESFTVTEEVSDCIRASDYVINLSDDGEGVKKRIELFIKLAVLARKFHKAGFNHQDFYLVHFFLHKEDDKIFIMDLQRVHSRESPSLRWRIKDLAQFVFSSLSTGKYTVDDFSIFWYEYFKKDRLSKVEEKMIKAVMAKAKRIARHDAKLIAKSEV